MQTILKLLGEIQSNWGDISPHPPLGFGTSVGKKMKQRQTKVEETDLLETIIRVEAPNKAYRHTLPLRSRLIPIVLVQAQG